MPRAGLIQVLMVVVVPVVPVVAAVICSDYVHNTPVAPGFSQAVRKEASDLDDRKTNRRALVALSAGVEQKLSGTLAGAVAQDHGLVGATLRPKSASCRGLNNYLHDFGGSLLQ